VQTLILIETDALSDHAVTETEHPNDPWNKKSVRIAVHHFYITLELDTLPTAYLLLLNLPAAAASHCTGDEQAALKMLIFNCI